MSARTRFAAFVRNVFRKSAAESDLHDELHAYADELMRQKMRGGLDEGEARRAALVEMGGVEQVKQQVRDARAGNTFDTIVQDVRYAVRGLRRSPGFTAVAVITLALGIGANTAIFSIVDGVLIRPAPVDDLDRLVVIWETDRQTGTTREPASVPDFVDLRTRARTVRPVVALAAGEVNLVPPRGEPERLAALRVSPELLPVLGFRPVAGRLFTEAEARLGGPPAALVSESLWHRAFGGRAYPVTGATIRLDDLPFAVVGVVPDVSDFGVLQVLGAAAYSRAFADRGEAVRVDVWLPQRPDPSAAPRDTHSLLVLGKLAPGRSVESAQQELGIIAADLERTYASNRGRGVHVEPFGDVVFGPVRPALALLLAAVAVVLLIACVNVANLLLARGAVRGHEVGVRLALGAGRLRLARQFLVESLVLSSTGAAVGVALAHVALSLLLVLAPPDVPRLATVSVDHRVLAATLALTIVVGIAFGLLPAFASRRLDVAGLLAPHGGARLAGTRALGRRRAALVVAEVSLALLLMAGAGLLIRSFWNVRGVDAGFRAGGVLKAEFQLPSSRYPARFADFPNFKEIHAMVAGTLSRAEAVPGVVSAAVAGNHPLDPGFTNSFSIVGREAEAATFPEISIRRVSAGYFDTVGLALVRGRLLDERDGTKAPAVVVINEAASRRFFGGRDPLGAQIRFWGAARTIVGIVADERLHGLAAAPPIALYAPFSQAPSVNGAAVLLLRTAGDPRALAGAARRILRAQDPQLAVFGVEPLDRTVARSLSGRRFVTLLLCLFAGLAVLLTAVGVHGVLAYTVAQRKRELGICMALGARPSDVLGAVLRSAAVLIAIGLALGVGGALLLSRFLASQLFGVTATDPLSFAAAATFLAVVALAAAAIPAWSAARIDPITTLRAD